MVLILCKPNTIQINLARVDPIQMEPPCIMCVQYMGGCSVHWGVQYIGGYHEYIGGFHEYIRGYHQYIRGCSVHQGDTMSTSGDIMSTSGMFSTLGDVQYIGVFNRN